MTEADEARRRALEDLVQLRKPLDVAAQRLNAFPWDSTTVLVVLTRSDVRRVLDGFLIGDLPAPLCEEWANELEGRDDLGLETGFEDFLKGFLFEVANPGLTRPLTRSTAEEWVSRST